MLKTFSWPNDAEIAFVIRDDDISFFTPPQKLEEIYQHAWEKGFKVSYALIPMQRSSFSPNVPPKYRTTQQYFNIKNNDDLTSFLDLLMDRGNVDILLHGYGHNNPHFSVKLDVKNKQLRTKTGEKIRNSMWLSEFFSLSENEVKQRIKEGKKILEETFNRDIQVFVPPNLYLTPIMLKILGEVNLACCSVTRSLLKKLLFQQVRESFVNPTREKIEQILNLFKIFKKGVSNDIVQRELATLKGTPLFYGAFFIGPGDFYTEKRAKATFQAFKRKFQRFKKFGDYFSVRTHYYSFFYDWEEDITQYRMKRYFDKIIDFVASQEDVWKCSFTEMVKYYNEYFRS